MKQLVHTYMAVKHRSLQMQHLGRRNNFQFGGLADTYIARLLCSCASTQLQVPLIISDAIYNIAHLYMGYHTICKSW